MPQGLGTERIQLELTHYSFARFLLITYLYPSKIAPISDQSAIHNHEVQSFVNN